MTIYDIICLNISSVKKRKFKCILLMGGVELLENSPKIFWQGNANPKIGQHPIPNL